MVAAMVGPTRSTAASSAAVASAIRSMSPNACARSGAVEGPTCRMLSATRNLASGRVLASSRLSSSLWPFAVKRPLVVMKNGARRSASSVRLKRSPSSISSPVSSRAAADW